jgi:signal transduction histidine kinase
MTKLLNRPLKAFGLYSMVILLISIPVYALVVDYIWINELDENNWLTLQHTKKKLQTKEFTKAEIEQIIKVWGELQPGLSIVKAVGREPFKDRVYEAIRPNLFDEDDGEDRFRGLESYTEINGEPYILTIETNVEESDDTFAAVAVITLVFFVILMIGFILLSRRIAARTWSTFYTTLNSLKSFELSTDNSVSLPKTNIEEFQELNLSIQDLIEKSVNTYQQQKAFTENASHELQTPIALLKSKMDLLIQQKNLTPEISELLSGIEAPLARLSRINKNLLLLAKVENHQYGDQEQLDICNYLYSTVNLFEDYLNEKQLRFSNEGKESSILVTANSFLVETLIHNLLSNAIRHTPVAGQIRVILQGASLSVINTGKDSLDETKMFERFSSTTTTKVSSGLGLAIMREVAGKYGWQIKYAFEGGFHVFSVNFH